MSYDFTETEKFINEWGSPDEIEARLGKAALELNCILGDEQETPKQVRDMQLALLAVFDLLDTIKLKYP